jgi:hypothetical protein
MCGVSVTALAAEEEVPEPPARQSAVFYMMGLGTPIGGLGAEGVHRLGSVGEIAVGAGMGFPVPHPGSPSNSDFQWAIMPRLIVPGDGRARLTFGAGLSGGHFEDICGVDPAEGCNNRRYVLWGNVELGAEFWGTWGFAMRVFLGLASEVVPGDPKTSDRTQLPYGGFGLGYAF